MATSLMKHVHEKRTRAEAAIRSILDAAASEGRELSAEEEQNIDRLDEESRTLQARLQQLLEDDAREKDLADALGEFRGADPQGEPVENPADELRKVARGESRGYEVMPPAVDSPEHRDLTKGTATAGGNTVPTSFYNQLMEHMIEVSGILAAGPTVFRTASGETFEVPVTTSHSSGALIAEGGTLTESDPAFAKRSLGAYKYGMSIQVSRELVDDSGVDLLGYLARQAGRAVGNALGTDLAVGNASSKPSGIVQTATTGVTGATTGVSGAFLADELIDLYFSVIGPYRNSPSCAWLMRDSTLARVRKLKSAQPQLGTPTLGGLDYLWQPSLIVGEPDTLLGKPVYTDPNIAAVATSAKSVVFGDISAYMVRLAGGIRFERSDEFAFQNDLVTFRCIVRGDGILADQTGAVKVFVGAGT